MADTHHSTRKWLNWIVLITPLVMVILVLLAASFYRSEPTYRLGIFRPDHEALRSGAAVKIGPVIVGKVEAIRLAPRRPDGTLDPNRNIEIVLAIQQKYQEEIRTDSWARVTADSALGDPYVSISRGLSGSPLVADSELPFQAQLKLEGDPAKALEVLKSLVEQPKKKPK